MSEPRPHPVWLAELRRPGSIPLIVPLTLPAPFGAGRRVEAVQEDLQRAIVDGWMEQGQYLELLARAPHLEPEGIALEVELPAVVAFPALKLAVPGAIARVASGFAVLLPSLGVQAWGPDRPAALVAGRAAVTGWVARHDLRADARDVAAMTWWSELELHRVELVLPRYTFHERKERAQARLRRFGRLLDKCATVLPAGRAFELEAARADLRRAALARVGAGVLVVGPHGSGKTVLVADEAHAPDSAFGGPVWSTTAARLNHRLTREGPWQEPLSRLCGELQREGAWLHVANLADLFEVGRYVGNDTSMGEYLRPWLGRGDVAIVAECTPEQRATIEARYPGFVEHLVQVDVPAPDEAAHTRVVTSFLRHLGGIELEAGDEAIRLQRRFVPYSGFPGRTLRFLVAVADTVPSPVQRVHVIERFCEESGIPRAFVDPAEDLPQAELRSRFEAALFGQPEAVDVLVDVATAIKADVAPRGRPVATLLFTGPTGVGKTEAARALASVLFGSRDRMVRFDMSEFATPHAVLQLASSPDPHGEGRLTGAVRRQPFAVVLLDEVEKAHPDFFDLLLQILGEGRLTDHRGRVASFCSAIVVMTSNLGADLALRSRVGIGRVNELPSELRDAVHRALRPELVNRLDRLVPFVPLPREAVLRVLDREIFELGTHLALVDRGATLTVSEAAREHLATLGHDPARGARPLQRVLRAEVIARVATGLDAEPTAPRPQIDVDRAADAGLTVTFTSRPFLPLPVPRIDQITTVRRELQAVVRGDTFAEHGSAWLLALRAARVAAEDRQAHRFDSGAIHRLPAPLNELWACLEQALVLEGEVLAEVVNRQPVDRALQAAALTELATRRATAERALCHAVHPTWGTAYLGLWAPADQHQPTVHEWTMRLRGVAEKLDLTVEHRDVWLNADQALEDAAVHASRPRGATKWAGLELWFEGHAAAALLIGAAGLYDLGTADQARCRVVVGVPIEEIPSCCETPIGVGLLRRPGGLVFQQWVAPRPANVLRKAAFEGKTQPWPPFLPGVDVYHRRIWRHLAGPGIIL